MQQQQLATFKQFWTTGGEEDWRALRRKRRARGERDGRRPKVDRVSEETFDDSYTGYILAFWGFFHNLKGYDLSKLKLEMLTDSLLIEEYNDWMIETRENTHVTSIQVITIAIAFCKHQYFSTVQRCNWSDVDLIEDLKTLRNEFKEKYKYERQDNIRLKAPNKKISYEELQQVCQ